MSDAGLPMYVVYKNPSDYPGKFVVRLCVAGRGTVTCDKEPLAVRGTLAEARAAIEALVGPLHRMNRQPDDDAVIVEVWL